MADLGQTIKATTDKLKSKVKVGKEKTKDTTEKTKQRFK